MGSEMCIRDSVNQDLTGELAKAAQCSEIHVCATRQDGFHFALHLAEHRIKHLVSYSRRSQLQADWLVVVE